MMFAAVAMIPLADATAISFLNPVFAIPLLGECVGPWRWTAAAVAFVGALILLRPGATIAPGALLSFGAAVVLGLEIIVLKLLSGREEPLRILLVNNLIALAISSVAVIWVWQIPTLPQIFTLAGVGLFMVSAQAFFVNAVARSEASYLVPFSYATLIFATVYDMAIFATRPDAITGLGAALIILSGITLAWREGRTSA